MMLLLLARLMGKWLKNDEKWSSKANMVLLSLKSHFRFGIVPTDAAVNLVFFKSLVTVLSSTDKSTSLVKWTNINLSLPLFFWLLFLRS